MTAVESSIDNTNVESFYCVVPFQGDDDGFGAASVVCCQSMLILYMGKHK